MKKRMLAILLAGLLAASAVGCQEPTVNPNLTGDPTSATTDNTTTAPQDDEPTPGDGFTQVTEKTVYALVDNLSLREEPSTTAEAKATVNHLAEMTLLKVNTTTKWSLVKYEGKEYYVLTAFYTDDAFTPVQEELYVKEKVNVRKYPYIDTNSTNDKTIVFKALDTNTKVNVVGKNKSWYQVMLDETIYFISMGYLSDTKVMTQDEVEAEMATKFSHDASNTTTWHIVNCEKLNFRTHPSLDENYSTYGGYIEKATTPTVQVTGFATIGGSSWAQIVYEIPDNEKNLWYVKAYYLSESGTSTLNTNLDSLLAKYTDFKKLAENKTMYASTNATGGIYLRYEPVIPTKYDENAVPDGILFTKDGAITVVAYNEKGDWCIVSHKDGFYFAETKHMTSSADGKPIMTVAQFITGYNLTICDKTEKTVLKDKIGFYKAPTLSATDKLGEKLKDEKVYVVATGIAGGALVNVIELAEGSFAFISGVPGNLG